MIHICCKKSSFLAEKPSPEVRRLVAEGVCLDCHVPVVFSASLKPDVEQLICSECFEKRHPDGEEVPVLLMDDGELLDAHRRDAISRN